MTRDEFINRLRSGLGGMPQALADDALADYEAHFDAALDEGRSEAEVAEALGDPRRLAREIKLEHGIRRWEEVRSPSAAWTAVIAFIGLGALDIMLLLPVLLSIIGGMIAAYAVAIAGFVAGGAMAVIGPFSAFPGGPLTAILIGIGLMALAIMIAALLTILTIWLINALMWFGRLHYRIIEPAIGGDTKQGRPE